MDSETESQLYQYLSEVGIKAVSSGRIDFNPVDLDMALDAIVADGDNFLLERMYSYALPGRGYSIAVELKNPNRIPDMEGWSEEHRELYESHKRINHVDGRWDYNPDCFNVEIGRVEKFDPVAFNPEPTYFYSLDVMENYGRLYNLVRKAKLRGYEIIEIYFGSSSESELILRPDKNHYFFGVNEPRLARRFMKHLIPGLE